MSIDGLSLPFAVNVGNPHAVFFTEEGARIRRLAKMGPKVENHQLFPERVKVSIATIQGENDILLNVWERGTGLTEACGHRRLRHISSRSQKRPD